MATYEDKWFEVWYSEGVDIAPAHLLVVTPNLKKLDQILIIDPFEKNKVIFEAKDYEAAHDWLCEDEYSLASGRDGDTGWL